MPEHELNQLIAYNITRQLELHNRTQSDLAEYMNVSQATVSNWCQGIKMPRMPKIDKICSFFNIKRSELMNEIDKTDADIDAPDYGNSSTPEEFVSLIKPYRDLDTVGKEAVKYTLDRETARIEAITKRDSQIKVLKGQLSAQQADIPSIVKDPNADYLIPRAAHARTDIVHTPEGKAHDDAIMDNDDEWN